MSPRECVAAWAVAFLLALTLMAADVLGLVGGGAVPYANGVGCDVWFYFSLVLSPESVAAMTPSDSRFMTRPLYFAPVHLLKSLLPAIDINVLSFLLFLPLATAALYAGLRSMFAPPSAALGAVLVGSTSLLITVMSSTFATVASAAYSNVMLACLMWGGRLASPRLARSDLLFAAAGVFFVFAANAHLMAIKFNFLYVLFAVPIHLLSRPYGPAVTVVGRAAGLFLVGMVVGIAATLSLSGALGLGFFMPYRQIEVALRGIADVHSAHWLHETHAFVLMGLLLMLSLWAVKRLRCQSGPEARRLYLLLGIAAATCLFNLHAGLIVGDYNLVHDYFYFLLLPCVGLTFCAAFADRIDRAGKTAFLALGATLVGLNLLIAVVYELKTLLAYKNNYTAYAVLAAVAVGLFLLRRRPGVSWSVALVAIGLHVAADNTTRAHYLSARVEDQAVARTTERAIAFIFAHVRSQPIAWIAAADNHRLDLTIFRGLQRCDYEPSFPGRLPDRPEALAAGRTLIVIDGEARPASRIQEALAPHGVGFEPVASRYFPRGDVAKAGVQITIGTLR